MKEKGKIIFLNGVTSTGKTTISKELQLLSNENLYHISNDIFQNMVSSKFLNKDYWKYLSEAIIIMYNTARTLSCKGISVIIDGMLLENTELKNHYKIMREIISDSPLILVEVVCPLEECKRRNIKRGDREEFQSHEQDKMMTKNIKYDITVDTYLNNPKECAEKILKHFCYKSEKLI